MGEATRQLSDQGEHAEPDALKGGDVYKWAVEQANLIRCGRYDEIDWVNVADEIESVGNSEYRSLSSNIEVVLMHMLKWDYQPARRSRSWAGSILEHRQRVASDLSESPSLKSKLRDATSRGYHSARITAAKETNIPLKSFPKECPYGWEDVMSRPFSLDEIDEIE